MEYTPDSWVLLKYQKDNSYAILSGWSGGYLNGDEWIRSSAIREARREADHWVVHTKNSYYHLRMPRLGFSILTMGVWKGIEDVQNGLGEILVELISDEDSVDRAMNEIMGV